MTLPSHLISLTECSEALPHWCCPNTDTKETPLRDVLSHPTLSETSKDPATHQPFLSYSSQPSVGSTVVQSH